MLIFFWLLRLLVVFQCALRMCAAQPQNESGSSIDTSGSTDTSPSVSIILFVGVGAFFFSGLLLVALRRQLAACFGINLNGGGGWGGVGSRGNLGLSREVIDAFPTYLYEEVNKLHGLMDRDQLECAICLNEFEPRQALRLLPECSHIFHPQCIDPWLLSQATCPVCRSTIPEPSSGSGSTSDASEDDPNHMAIRDLLPFVKTPTRQDLEYGSPSQPVYLMATKTVKMSPTTKAVPTVLEKSHSTGHAISFMERRCEMARPLYSRDRAGLSEGAKIPWRGRMEFNRSGGGGGDQQRLDLGSLNQNPTGFSSQAGSPISDNGVCYA